MALIAITRLRVRFWRYLPAFFVQTLCSARQAKSAKGNLAVSVLSEGRKTFWTRTAWVDERAMRSYMLSAPHSQAMRKLPQWCDEAAVVHWTQESSQLPSWEDAHRRLQQDGRASRVNRPTEAHRLYRIPAPSVSRTGNLRFK